MNNLLLKEARERTCTQQHRWTEYAADGISTCVLCGAERGQLVAPSDDETHFSSNGPLKPTSKCKHLWAAPDEESIRVCCACGEERSGR